MTRIKLCGLSRIRDIEAANALAPDYVGFVFAENSRRYVTPEQAAALKSRLAPGIAAVGVTGSVERVHLLRRGGDEDVAVRAFFDLGLQRARGVIDMAQLHGSETEDYVRLLRTLTDKPLLQAFRIHSAPDCRRAAASSADYVLLDSGAGTGRAFDWELVREVGRPYFLAGGLDAENVGRAVLRLHPYAVDVSSGIETDGSKDRGKMEEFVRIVREADGRGE